MAIANVEAGLGGPFAAVVVKNGAVIARGTNRVTTTNDPTAHAEVVAIRAACAALTTFELKGCEIYTTCEPCPMCLGAIYWAHLDAVKFGSTRDDAAAAGFDDSLIYDEIAVTFNRRKIPMEACMRDEAQAVFAAWTAYASRIHY